MDDGVFVFQKTKPSLSLIDEILAFDVRKIEQTDSSTISQYTLAMSQYSIFFKSQINMTKAEIFDAERIIDTTVSTLMTVDIIKKYKTKKEAASYIISSTEELSKINDKTALLKKELLLVEGIDKTISDYISSFKRELTRRADENWQTRKERNG